MTALLLALALGAGPALEIGPGLEPAGPIVREAQAGWSDLEQLYRAVTHAEPPAPPHLLLKVGAQLRPDQAGASRVGVVELRKARDVAITEESVTTLRHELAHQFLWAACPASSGDALFHEAFALATSGELAAWTDATYLSMNAARKQLMLASSLDSRSARSALARLMVNSPSEQGLPRPLAMRLRRCADRAAWLPLTVDELVQIPLAEGDAVVVLSRHSGEVLALEGDARVALPFGSTLKPFLAAGAAPDAPRLVPDSSRDEWSCGDALPAEVDLAAALLRSCNGYFLDWGKRRPELARLGAYGPLLRQLGLAHLPESVSEAIGLRPTLKLSPLAVAQAYRVLAEASPGILAMLRDNAERGTLAGLEASPRLRGIALKTGTVRDADARPELGWIVAVNDDVIAVMVRKGRMPRSFADALAETLSRFHGRAQARAQVQVLGLVPPERVEAQCKGVPVLVTREGPKLAATTSGPLESLAKQGEAVCLGAPWLLRFPGGPEGGRAYAGTFRWDSPPPYRPPEGGPPVPERARRAREGSPFIFSTRLGLYTSSVLAAEDAQIAGEPRRALALTVAHNASASRHPARPVCDTTHCQAFLGTVAPRPSDASALEESDVEPGGWLPFSQGGDEPWSEVRPLTRVARVLGASPVALRFQDGTAEFTVRSSDGDAVFEDHGRLACEPLRNALQLPSCPERAEVLGNEVRFQGHGRGHGLGLDLERAKKSASSHAALLREAYPSAQP